MPISFRSSTAVLLLSGVLITVSACHSRLLSSFGAGSTDIDRSVEDAIAPAPVSDLVTESPVTTASPTEMVNTYEDAIAKASSAFRMGQSAQSQDDWRLVASRWQQAIDLMAVVPANSPSRALAQSKLIEYRRNLNYAQQQANRPAPSSAPDETVVRRSQPPQASVASSPRPAVTENRSMPTTAQPQASAPQPNHSKAYSTPIIRRAGGTPVIRVMFNGNRPFDMIVDTGASGTLITQGMASALGVVPVAEANMDTASAKNVTFPLGYVNSIEVNGAIAQNVLVAIAGPDVQTGLLGHNFFGNYDVTIRQDMVEFHER